MGQKPGPVNYQSPIDTNRSHNPQKLQSSAVLACSDNTAGGGHLTLKPLFEKLSEHIDEDRKLANATFFC
jgi:hypothetical protein